MLTLRTFLTCGLVALACGLVVRVYAVTSPAQAEAFSSKVARIQEQASRSGGTPVRTPVTQDELNSWFAYRAPDRLPAGVSQVQMMMIGGGRLEGQATVDLEVVGKRRSSGGAFDPLSYLGGRVPVTVHGVLQSRNGMARFELEDANVSGIPVPSAFLQELVTYYSRTPESPEGVRLDDTFALPANIQQIEVGQGRAVVVQ